MSTTYGDIVNADVAILAGTNTTANHPVASSFFKQARRRGTKLIVVDPRRERIADHADVFCQIKPGTDVAFYNGVMHEIIRLGLVDREFIAERTTNYAELAKMVKEYPPERAAQICGIDADMIRAVARLWGEAGAAVVFWGMGISPAHDRHRQRPLPDRAVLHHRPGRPSRHRPAPAARPEQRAGRLRRRADPDDVPRLPAGRRAGGPRALRGRWGRELDPDRGLTVTEIIDSALHGGVRGMYMMGENPFLSDPNINKVRKALAALEFLVVQDIFLTETAEFADVVLPATSYLEKEGTYTNTDRRVQIGRKVLDAPGEARLDWHIIQDISNRIGLRDELRVVARDLRRARVGDAQLRRAVVRQPGRRRASSTPTRTPSIRRDRRAVRRALRHRRRQGAPGAGRVAAGQGAAERRVSRSC